MKSVLKIVNAALPLRDESALFTLSAEDGIWTAVERQAGAVEPSPATMTIDGWNGAMPAEGGALLLDAGALATLPAFIDAHMHLDKAFSLPKVGNVTGTLEEAVRNYSALVPGFTKDELKARMMRAALQAISFGSTTLRTHLDFHVRHGKEVALRTIEAALEVREALAPYATIQLFPMLPYYDLTEEALDTAAEALRMGVTGLGGAPHLSPEPKPDIDRVFELAEKHDCPIDLHADESDNPNIRTAAYIARKTLDYGWSGRVTAGHLCSLAAMADEDARPIISLLAEAGVGAVTLPGANLYLQGRHDRFPVRRGVTRVKELLAAGVPVAAASDNIHDPFHPFGRGDLLLIGLVTAYAAHMGSPADIREALRMITDYPAAVVGVRSGIEPGLAADFVVLDAATPEELLTMLPERRWVWRRGRCLRAAAPRAEWNGGALQSYWEDACERVSFRQGRD
ncbi:amidohydrolase family protein [Paenibacillus rhizovicinus]|uniref:Amidohydrolase family protein n=1 Tax=Paenibacillus rhizovicinus TaxID=2704463 RepID=A0A6C0NTN7_9BACL|nr:amidohydrolase family protein [Paenibacillus rhizovicinus]QHW29481.1 amidohydrolase family protein [Paenibacillus rhizovicinus]